MKKKFFSLLRGLDRDERGTSMTEFVITLPMFIVIFAGVGSLTRMEKESVRTKLAAARATWNEAIPVHNTQGNMFPGFEHTMPVLAAANELSELSSHPSPGGDLPQLLSSIGLLQGHLKQAERTTDWWKSAVRGNPPAVPKEGADFAKKMTSDSAVFDPLPFPSGRIVVFALSVPYSLGGSRHAQGAGIRYGTAAGSASRSGSIRMYNFNYENGYDVMVSPAAVGGSLIDEMVTVGFSRIPAQKESACLGNVLGVDKATWKC